MYYLTPTIINSPSNKLKPRYTPYFFKIHYLQPNTKHTTDKEFRKALIFKEIEIVPSFVNNHTTMNSFIQNLLSIQYGKACPEIKMVSTVKDIITVHFANGSKKSFKITATHIKEGS